MIGVSDLQSSAPKSNVTHYAELSEYIAVE
jgi:hypothetical protein